MSSQEFKSPKIAIVGAGFAGTTFAFSVLIHGLASQVVLINRTREKAEGEVMDLTHGMPFANPMQIVAGDYRDCANAQ